MVSFHIAGIPEAMPVRDENSGLVVDGYKLTVVSNDTGARAVLQIPKSRFSIETVAAEAETALSAIDDALAAFAKPAK